jgi:hypothetical protein
MALAIAAAVGGLVGASDEALVASVGGKGITDRALNHWMTVEVAADGRAAPGRSALRRRALGLLILWDWTLGEAHEVGVRVGEGEAKKQLELSKIIQAEGVKFELLPHERDMTRFLLAPKVAPSDQLWLIKLGMLALRLTQHRLASARSAIAPARVLAYYRRHRGQFVAGERRDIKAIMNSSRAKVVEAKRELQAGRRFASVAERYNQSIEGGLRLGRARGAGKKRYEKDYFAAPPHVLVGPLHEILYYIFEVMSIRPGYQKTLTQAEPAIRQRLAAHDESAILLQAYERKWRARTRCRAGYAAPGCGRYEAAIAG